jgi:hypothetical protein
VGEAAQIRQEPDGTQQEKLLAELLALDKAFEAGTIKKAAYEERRAKLKARLRAVMSTESGKTPATAATPKAATTHTKKAVKGGRRP